MRVRAILTPTGIRFTSIILPKTFYEALFLSQQNGTLWNKPYVLSKKFQCKQILNLCYIHRTELMSPELFLQSCDIIKYGQNQTPCGRLQIAEPVIVIKVKLG